jgi:hypothetical protein
LGFWFTSLTHWVSELAGHWCCQIWHMCSHSSQPKVHMHWHKGEARDIRSTSNRQKGSITKLLSPWIAYVHQQHHRACMHNLTIRWLQDTHCQVWSRSTRTEELPHWRDSPVDEQHTFFSNPKDSWELWSGTPIVKNRDLYLASKPYTKVLQQSGTTVSFL